MSAVGYVCKRCDAPSPPGVGYVDSTPGADLRSKDVVQCPCGHSVSPLDIHASVRQAGIVRVARTVGNTTIIGWHVK